MNEQLQQAIAVLIEKSLKAFEAGADFMADQLPDVVQQLLMWYMVLGGVKAVAAVMLLVTASIVAYKGIGWTRNAGKYVDGWFIYSMCSILWLPVIMLSVHLWNLTWLQIWVAPKIFLIEYAARMVAK